MSGSSTSFPVMVCADDFGLSPGVNDAIVTLIAAQRLSATSCMTNLPEWRTGARALRSAAGEAGGRVGVGLHLTLTDHRPLSHAHTGMVNEGRLLPLSRLLLLALCRALPLQGVKAEVCAQLDAFEEEWGQPPDHIDGHQHVHLLPGIRECVIDELTRRYSSGQVWVRSCVERPWAAWRRQESVFKAWFISVLGWRMHILLGRAQIPFNHGFSGVYDFSDRLPFRERFRQFLSHMGTQPLIQVHPGWVDAALISRDPVTTQREEEYAYLASEAFLSDLAEAGRCLGYFPRQVILND